MFDCDKPIKNHAEDRLNRNIFSQNLAKLVMNFDAEESIVIGLMGNWGVGKSSIINMFLEHISEYDNSPIILEFNPWNFSGQDNLFFSFFNELLVCLKSENDSDDIVELVKKYRNRIIFSGIHFISGMVHPGIQNTISNYWDLGDEKDTLEGLKYEIRDILSKEDSNKIVIIIDDIDRLLDSEIRQIFQLVKSLADFPNIIYMLSFDKKQVENALNEDKKNSTEEFINKIVQIPIEVPKIHKRAVETLFKSLFSELMNKYGYNFNEENISNLFTLLNDFLNSIRDVKRFLNILDFYMPLVKNEININEFILITAIQTFESNLYHKLKMNKYYLTGYVGDGNRLKNSESFKNFCYDLLNNIHKDKKESVKKILMELFPKIEAFYYRGSYRPERSFNKMKIDNISSENKFEFYFTLNLEEEDLSTVRIKNIFSVSAKDKNIFKQELFTICKENKLNLLFSKLNDNLIDIPKINTQNIVEALMDVPFNKLFKNNTTSINDFIESLLRTNLDSSEERFEVLKKSIENSNYMYLPVEIVNNLDYMFDLIDKDDYVYEEVVNKNQLSELKNILVNKLNNYSNLINEDNLCFILQVWDLFSQNNAQNFVNNISETDEGLIEIIKAFSSDKHFNYSNDEYNKEILFDSFEKFLNIDKTNLRLNEIKKSNLKLYDNNKYIIDLFLLGKIDYGD